MRAAAHTSWPALLLACVVGSSLEAFVTAAAPERSRITFELLTKQGVPLNASQQWYKALSDLGISGLQIHNFKAGDEMAISESGGKASRGYKVVGILAADNVLYLPGGKFKLTDTGRLRAWLDNLDDQGTEGVTQPRGSFGLTPRQFESVKDDLKQPVGFSTQGNAALKAVNQIAGSLKFKLELDDASRKQLVGVKVAEELQTLARGTALAVVLRPAALVFEPERTPGSEIHYRVHKAQSGREAWPIGWKAKGNRGKLLPLLFEHLKVDITETPVSEAVDSIQTRLEVPFLYDQNALALHGVDPSKAQAAVSSTRLTYSQILGKILLQAKLQFDLRLDDADHSFLWITTIKPAP